jgi:hypothetical protein
MSSMPGIREGEAVSPELLSDATKDFSLVLGGPVYQLLRRAGLVKPPLDRVGWRIVIITAFAWAPLVVLTALGGRLTGGVKIPFLHDFEVHARLLGALPLLIAAELTVHRRIRALLVQFVDRQVVGPAVLPRFEACVASAVRLRNSTIVELGLLALALVAGGILFRQITALQSDTWYAAMTPPGRVLAPAGYWYEFVSVPIVQFVTWRWYYRLFIWARLLWQISRLDLTLVPSHPDGCCGLGFLASIGFALGPFLMAHSVLLSGYLANRILYEGAALPDYKLEIAAVAVFLYVVALGPVSVFTPDLLKRRLHGLHTYGALASQYVIGFEEKWMRGHHPSGESLVGSGDIQSLADLANSFSVVQHIRPFPFDVKSLVGVAVFIAVPLLPLGLTMFSFQELVERLLQVVL